MKTVVDALIANSVRSNSVTSASGQNLVLAVGTGGTALTITTSTLAAAFAGAVSLAGNLSVNTTGANTFGSTSGLSYILIKGSATGTGGGANLLIQNDGTSTVGLGNKSSLIGGAYSADPTLWYSGSLNFITGSTVYATLTNTGIFTLASTTASTSASTGALIVSGGAGIADQLSVGNNLRFFNNSTLPGQGSIGKSATYGLNIYAATGSTYDLVIFTAAGTSLLLNPTGTANLIAGGALNVTSTTASTSTGTGALVVAGGLGVAGAAFIGGGAEITGASNIAGRLRVTSGGFASYGSLTLGAAYAGMGGGFQVSYESPTTRVFYGDGSGFDLRFCTRASSTTTDRLILSDSGNITMYAGSVLQIGATYAAGAPTATGYLTIKDATGTSYKIPAVAV